MVDQNLVQYLMTYVQCGEAKIWMDLKEQPSAARQCVNEIDLTLEELQRNGLIKARRHEKDPAWIVDGLTAEGAHFLNYIRTGWA